jgi:hypothetical protein
MAFKERYMAFPTVVKNATDANGRCGHNMIPAWCAYCNPVVFKKRKKIKKKNASLRKKSLFIFVLIDLEDGEELERFYDKDDAIKARNEIREMMDDDDCCRIDIIDNPDHPLNMEDKVEKVESNGS